MPLVTSVTAKAHNSSHDALTVTWASLLNTDNGSPFAVPRYADRSVQVFGTFGASGNLRIQGSNDGVNWAVLTDPQGNDLNITTAKIEMVTEVTVFIRPLITAGDGTTNLTCILLARSTI